MEVYKSRLNYWNSLRQKLNQDLDAKVKCGADKIATETFKMFIKPSIELLLLPIAFSEVKYSETHGGYILKN